MKHIPATLAPALKRDPVQFILAARKHGLWDFETVPALLRYPLFRGRIGAIERIINFVRNNPQQIRQ
jgi:hypothetical protein